MSYNKAIYNGKVVCTTLDLAMLLGKNTNQLISAFNKNTDISGKESIDFYKLNKNQLILFSKNNKNHKYVLHNDDNYLWTESGIRKFIWVYNDEKSINIINKFAQSYFNDDLIDIRKFYEEKSKYITEYQKTTILNIINRVNKKLNFKENKDYTITYIKRNSINKYKWYLYTKEAFIKFLNERKYDFVKNEQDINDFIQENIMNTNKDSNQVISIDKPNNFFPIDFKEFVRDYLNGGKELSNVTKRIKDLIDTDGLIENTDFLVKILKSTGGRPEHKYFLHIRSAENILLRRNLEFAKKFQEQYHIRGEIIQKANDEIQNIVNNFTIIVNEQNKKIDCFTNVINEHDRKIKKSEDYQKLDTIQKEHTKTSINSLSNRMDNLFEKTSNYISIRWYCIKNNISKDIISEKTSGEIGLKLTYFCNNNGVNYDGESKPHRYPLWLVTKFVEEYLQDNYNV